jgi:hypothetical protein
MKVDCQTSHESFSPAPEEKNLGEKKQEITLTIWQSPTINDFNFQIHIHFPQSKNLSSADPGRKRHLLDPPVRLRASPGTKRGLFRIAFARSGY